MTENRDVGNRIYREWCERVERGEVTGTEDTMTSAYARYITDATYDLDHALADGMTDDEYIEVTDPYNDDTPETER